MVRWWRFALLALAGVVAALAGTIAAVTVNVATGGTSPWFPALEARPLWWMAGATGTVAGAGLLALLAQRWYERGLAVLVPAVQRPEPWVVDRPVEVDQIVRALRRRSRPTVGITTAVHGAGGFGKTTVAKMVRADGRVLRRFEGQVYWVTLGRDVRKEALARKVNDLITQIQPAHPVTFTDARQAGEHLAAVLSAGPRRLVVLDDVWFEDQIAVFPVAGRCARLVTTRNPSLVTANSVPVKVDQMSVAQARAVLLADLTQLPPSAVVDGLIGETGRWPLLLRLTNKILVDQARLQLDVTSAADDLLDRIRRGGVLQLDQLTEAAGQQLDVSDPDQRQRTVRATIEASTGLLTATDRDRLAELAVFAEDETVPVTLVAALWQATGGLDGIAAGTTCARLADLALVKLIRTDNGGAIELHDVVREYLRLDLGDTRLTQLHRVLLHAAAGGLPTASAATNDGDGSGKITAWWKLPSSARYLWDHLLEHLLAAGQAGEAEALAVDLRWVGARLEQSGPAGPFEDLTLIQTPRAERLRRLFGQTAHLLAPTEPPQSLIDILYSRVGHDLDWGAQVRALTPGRRLPALINRWPPPDLPDPALRRILIGHTNRVNAVAIAPDGTWLATGSDDRSVRIWDPVTGQQRAPLTCGAERIIAVVIAPDRTWLVSYSGNWSMRIWDPVTGQPDTTLPERMHYTFAVAFTPDGTWLATGGSDGSVRIWDPVTGQQRATLTSGVEPPLAEPIRAVAIAPDGTWLATGGNYGSVTIWDVVTGQQRATFTTGHRGEIMAVAIASDGTWLATGSRDGSVRIWDPVNGQQRATLTGHTDGVKAVAIAPDGTWLATGSDDGSVRIWDPVNGQQRATLTGHTDGVTAVAIAPDGTWLATGGGVGQVRIWDAVTNQQYTAPTGYIGPMSAVAFAPDGTRLATGSDDGSVQIWDAVTGEQRATFTTGHRGEITAMAIAPDGTRLATGGRDGSVQIWDAVTGEQRATLTGFLTQWVTAVAITPDGTCLFTDLHHWRVEIWDAVTGEQRTTRTSDTDDVEAVAITPDGKWIATGGRRGSVRIWDPVTGQQRATLTSGVEPPIAEPIRWMAITPDGSWLAIVNRDGSVRTWDAITGQQRPTFTGHTAGMEAVAITPDGTWLAIVNRDGSVRIWDAVTGDLSAVMRVDGSLTDCVWNPSDLSLFATGSRGLYHFTFKP